MHLKVLKYLTIGIVTLQCCYEDPCNMSNGTDKGMKFVQVADGSEPGMAVLLYRKQLPAPGQKKCPLCCEIQPLHQFASSHSYCKPCKLDVDSWRGRCKRAGADPSVDALRKAIREGRFTLRRFGQQVRPWGCHWHCESGGSWISSEQLPQT